MSSCNLEEHVHCQPPQPARRSYRRWLLVAERVFWIVVCLLALFSGCTTTTIHQGEEILSLDGIASDEPAPRTPNPLRSGLADRVPEDLSSLTDEPPAARPIQPLRRLTTDAAPSEPAPGEWVRYVEPTVASNSLRAAAADPATEELIERARRLMSRRIDLPSRPLR